MVKSLNTDITIITMRSTRRPKDIALVTKFEFKSMSFGDENIRSVDIAHVLRTNAIVKRDIDILFILEIREYFGEYTWIFKSNFDHNQSDD